LWVEHGILLQRAGKSGASARQGHAWRGPYWPAPKGGRIINLRSLRSRVAWPILASAKVWENTSAPVLASAKGGKISNFRSPRSSVAEPIFASAKVWENLFAPVLASARRAGKSRTPARRGHAWHIPHSAAPKYGKMRLPPCSPARTGGNINIIRSPRPCVA